MELKDQVCSLELSEKLKGLGIKQESLWWWHRDRECFTLQGKLPEGEPFLDRCNEQMSFPDELLGSAFTVAELGEMLPESIKEKRLLWISKINKEWHINYAKHTKDGEPYGWLSPANWNAVTEANTRAAMVIYLIEKKLLKVSNG